jgi:hypothetical protein
VAYTAGIELPAMLLIIIVLFYDTLIIDGFLFRNLHVGRYYYV